MSLVGKTVKVKLKRSIKTHFSSGTKTLYGYLNANNSQFILIRIGYIFTPKAELEQIHMIGKEFIQSISLEHIGVIERGKKEWYTRTDAWIPPRDEQGRRK